MAERFIVRWPHNGDPVSPWQLLEKNPDTFQQWLEDTETGECITEGTMEPEDACLGRDLDDFVSWMNSLAADLNAEKTKNSRLREILQESISDIQNLSESENVEGHAISNLQRLAALMKAGL
jgi:hypothetical protein